MGVKWGRRAVSGIFGISNGIKQGSVASPTFWAVYLNPMIEELRASGVGCYIAGVFMGLVVYADDVFLLAPNRRAAQIMLNICQKFAESNNFQFSTNPDPRKSKSKALHIIGQKQSVESPYVVLLFHMLRAVSTWATC